MSGKQEPGIVVAQEPITPMSDGAKTPKPFDGVFEEDEASAVRSRPAQPKPKSGAYAAVVPGPQDGETITQRTARIDQKMAIATTLLREMSPLDARARLLSSAILRRDEVLLDAILSGMAEQALELAANKSR
jgi:hypothetical protein